ncbi:MAG: hypothetical protein AAF902_17730 [Chloroflexota bacterium]
MAKKHIFISALILMLIIPSLWLYLNPNRLAKVDHADGDYLVYATAQNYGKSDLFFYDPEKDLHEKILTDWEIKGVSLSKTDRLAISAARDGLTSIFVLDYPFVGSEIKKVSGKITTEYGYRMEWSNSGQLLAYSPWVLRSEPSYLYIWDGKQSKLIAQSKGGFGDMDWGPNNQLAYVDHRLSSDTEPDEIFIWDLEKTVNLSQNPNGTDRFPKWNEDGELAFISERNGDYDVFVWNGSSFDQAGRPDASSFENIAPQLTQYYSNPVWTASGTVSFTGRDLTDPSPQIYDWDGLQATNVSRQPNIHAVGQEWHQSGNWSYFRPYWDEPQTYVLDANNDVQLELKAFDTTWSDSGYFAACEHAKSITDFKWNFQNWQLPKPVIQYETSFNLLFVNGDQINTLANGKFIYAAWSNGNRLSCSLG